MGMQLRRCGTEDFTIYGKERDVGGTVQARADVTADYNREIHLELQGMSWALGCTNFLVTKR
jgi:hypothetical protein